MLTLKKGGMQHIAALQKSSHATHPAAILLGGLRREAKMPTYYELYNTCLFIYRLTKRLNENVDINTKIFISNKHE